MSAVCGLDLADRFAAIGFTFQTFRPRTDQEVKYGALRGEWLVARTPS